MKNENQHLLTEFQSFAKSRGIGSLALHDYSGLVTDAITPYVFEERKLNGIQIDIFSRLLRDRIIWLSGEFNSLLCDIVQAQLMFLDAVNHNDITIHLNTPGGCVSSGLAILDVIDYIKSDVAMINVGMAASMGAVLLCAGAKGKRGSLMHSKVMIHQVSHGTSGNVQDTRINQLEAEKYNYILFKIIARHCGKDVQEVIEWSRRDRWYHSDQALKFGIIDRIIGNENNSITSELEGFDDYYQREVLQR